MFAYQVQFKIEKKILRDISVILVLLDIIRIEWGKDIALLVLLDINVKIHQNLLYLVLQEQYKVEILFQKDNGVIIV